MEEAKSCFIENEKENNHADDEDNVETTISKILDNFGTFQIRSLVMICPVYFFLGVFIFTPVFLNYTPHFICRPAKNFTKHLTSVEEFEEMFQNISSVDKCSRIKFSENTTLENYVAQLSQLNETLTREECNDGWWFSSSEERTVVTEFNLICDNAWKRPTTVSVLMVGMLFGSLMGGSLSDRFGRKLTVVVTYAINFLLEISLSFSNSYVVYLIQTFFVGFVHIVVYIGAYVWAQELAHNGNKRNLAALGINLSYTFGETLIPLIAYFAYDWRWIYRVIAIISIIYFPIILLAPESPQWSLRSRNQAEFFKMLKRIIKVNKMKINEECLKNLTLYKKSEDQSSTKVETVESSPLILIRNNLLRKRIFIICFLWNATHLGFYTLALNSGNLGGSIYINSLVGNSVDVVSVICMAVLLKKFGRRNSLAFSFGMSGAFCLLSPLLKNVSTTAGIASATTGRFFVVIATTITILYTGELFPTLVRNTSVGIASMSARIFSILSPFLIFMGEEVDLSIPFYIMAAVCSLATVLTFFLPETSKTLLPDTLEDIKDQEKYSCFKVYFGKNTDSEAMQATNIDVEDNNRK